MNTLNRMWQSAAAMGLSILVAGAVSFPLSVNAAGNNTSTRSENMMKHRQEMMMAMRNKMLTQAKAEDAALTKLVAKMNKAPEARKVDLMATILTKLVAQHHQMLGEWETMHTRMMQFRKERMQMGAANASKSSMTSKSSMMNCMPGGKMTTAQK